MYYEVVSVVNGMIGGHYAVKGPGDRLIGKDFGLDHRRANILANELTMALELGKSHGALSMDLAVETSPSDGHESMNK